MISPPPSLKIYCPPPDPGHTWLRPLCEAWWQASSVRHPAALLVVVGQAQPPGLDLPIRGEYCAPPITAHLVPAAAGVLALPPELLQRIVLCPGIAWESKYLQKNDLRKAFRNETFLLVPNYSATQNVLLSCLDSISTRWPPRVPQYCRASL